MTRSIIVINKNRITKKVIGSELLYNSIRLNLIEYASWLKNAGFILPETDVCYKDGEIVFEQLLVTDKKRCLYKTIIDNVLKLKFDKFGLDANPDNFIQGDLIYFVDLFPFLVRDRQILNEQFDYSPNETLKRYFTCENVIFFYIVRLFIIDFDMALDSLVYAKSLIIEKYDNIMDREKLRMLYALNIRNTKDTNIFAEIYSGCKKINNITESDNQELRRLIIGIN